VREHIPTATYTQTESIPEPDASGNFIECNDCDDNILTFNVNWEENTTGFCKFYIENDEGVEKEENIKCELDGDGKFTNKFKFEQKYEKCIWFGREVNDFIVIDKHQIFALHHSAIQELSRRNDAKTAKNVELERRCAEAEAKNVELQTKITSMEADIAIVKEKLGL